MPSVAKDGTLNLAQLNPTVSAAAQTARDEERTVAARCASVHFKVTRAWCPTRIAAVPPNSRRGWSRSISSCAISPPGVEGGRFTFTGASNLGERIEWHGHLSVQPIESDGELQIDGLQAHTIWEYLEDQLNFADQFRARSMWTPRTSFRCKDGVDLQVERLAKLRVGRPRREAEGLGQSTGSRVPAADGRSAPPLDLANAQAHMSIRCR